MTTQSEAKKSASTEPKVIYAARGARVELHNSVLLIWGRGCTYLLFVYWWLFLCIFPTTTSGGVVAWLECLEGNMLTGSNGWGGVVSITRYKYIRTHTSHTYTRTHNSLLLGLTWGPVDSRYTVHSLFILYTLIISSIISTLGRRLQKADNHGSVSVQ